MAIWQPKMDGFLCEHILRGCREIQKNKIKKQNKIKVPTKEQIRGKMTGNTDNH